MCSDKYNTNLFRCCKTNFCCSTKMLDERKIFFSLSQEGRRGFNYSLRCYSPILTEPGTSSKFSWNNCVHHTSRESRIFDAKKKMAAHWDFLFFLREGPATSSADCVAARWSMACFARRSPRKPWPHRVHLVNSIATATPNTFALPWPVLFARC